MGPKEHPPAARAAGALGGVTWVLARRPPGGRWRLEAEGPGALGKPRCRPGPRSGGLWCQHWHAAGPGCLGSGTGPRAPAPTGSCGVGPGAGRPGRWPRPPSGRGVLRLRPAAAPPPADARRAASRSCRTLERGGVGSAAGSGDSLPAPGGGRNDWQGPRGNLPFEWEWAWLSFPIILIPDDALTRLGALPLTPLSANAGMAGVLAADMVPSTATWREEFNLSLISGHLKAWDLVSPFPHILPPPGSPPTWLRSLGVDLLLLPDHLTALCLRCPPLYLIWKLLKAGCGSPPFCPPPYLQSSGVRG